MDPKRFADEAQRRFGSVLAKARFSTLKVLQGTDTADCIVDAAKEYLFSDIVHDNRLDHAWGKEQQALQPQQASADFIRAAQTLLEEQVSEAAGKRRQAYASTIEHHRLALQRDAARDRGHGRSGPDRVDRVDRGPGRAPAGPRLAPNRGGSAPRSGSRRDLTFGGDAYCAAWVDWVCSNTMSKFVCTRQRCSFCPCNGTREATGAREHFRQGGGDGRRPSRD